jgi:vancomycin resistance protein VanW
MNQDSRKRRTFLRKLVGKPLHRLCRQAQWHLGGRRYARLRAGDPLPAVCTQHSTPLIRSLANLDMWLQRNKIVNLGIAAGRLNGVVVRPGETFSFWKLVGRPARRKGYLPGMVLDEGRLKPGTGGGLCQLTNLLYWMTLHTPLTVTERYRHSYDVFPDSNRTQPFGSGATCAYSRFDLQIHNGTDAPYQLELALDGERLAGRWRSASPCGLRYEVYERGHRISCNAPGGYTRHNELWRKAYDGEGKLVCDEFIAQNDALMMYQPYLKAAEETI